MIDTNTPARNNDQRRQGGGPSRRPRRETAPSEFDEKVLEVNRVTRVVKGGKRMRFRALVVIGDRAGRVSYGLGKASDVTTAVAKGVVSAKKIMKTIYLREGTLPYQVNYVSKSARVLIKPAKPGTGLIAGGAVRIVLELAGVKDAVAKILGSSNKVSNVVATIEALASVTAPNELMARRGFGKKIKPEAVVADQAEETE